MLWFSSLFQFFSSQSWRIFTLLGWVISILIIVSFGVFLVWTEARGHLFLTRIRPFWTILSIFRIIARISLILAPCCPAFCWVFRRWCLFRWFLVAFVPSCATFMLLPLTSTLSYHLFTGRSLGSTKDCPIFHCLWFCWSSLGSSCSRLVSVPGKNI